MMEITAEIRAFIDKAAAGAELAEDEYIDPSDGLIHCKKCGGQRQTVVPCFGKPGYFMPRCICQCQREAEEQRKAAEERQRRMERIKRRKAQGLQDRYLYDYTFANDNGQNPLMEKARAYVENWKEAYRNNTGLLLFGDVGTGKSFFAGCIANALLDQDVPVLMTNFPTILNRLTGMFSEDKADFIASFDEYDLLIIDDLGVERSTEYAMEQMFFVIDSRYRSCRPMIITTNLKLSELKNPPDLAHARIYDRILERCAPILFDGKNFREENASATRQTAKLLYYFSGFLGYMVLAAYLRRYHAAPRAWYKWGVALLVVAGISRRHGFSTHGWRRSGSSRTSNFRGASGRSTWPRCRSGCSCC